MSKTSAWIDPRSVDWTDSFNPLRNPRTWPTNNPWRYQNFNDPLWVAIRKAKNLVPTVCVVPDPQDQLIPPSTTYDQAVTIEPGTWLLGFCAYSSNPATGFQVQITDALTGAVVFSQPIQSANLSPSGANGPIVWLAQPRYFVPPSYPIVRIINNDQNNARTCIVYLYCALETDLATGSAAA